MSDKLAARHKSSLVLNSPLKKSHLAVPRKFADCEEQMEQLKNSQRATILPLVFCAFLFVYWLIACPIVWALLLQTDTAADWPIYWRRLFWLVAFAIWLVAMLALLIVSRCAKNRDADRLTAGILPSPTPTLYTQMKNVQPEVRRSKLKKREPENSNGDGGGATRRERKKLSPLVIHRNMSGERNEIAGDVDVHVDREKSFVDNDPERTKRYLQIVPVQTPITPGIGFWDEARDEAKSPLSPRELFFIDLIRGVENADVSSTRNSAFFPQDKSAPADRDSEDRSAPVDRDAKDKPAPVNRDSKDKSAPVVRDSKEKLTAVDLHSKNKQVPVDRDPEDTSYFIANVATPVTEKNEVFIEISLQDGEKDANGRFKWTVDGDARKPQLTLESVSNESEETRDVEEEKL